MSKKREYFMIDINEKEITKNWKGDINKPFVSICTITYNHEKYITEALDSFLIQETNFSFEIVVDDDCSTDGAPAVIRKYMEKFPHIIKTNLREKNVGAIINHIENMKRAKGKYIALCEGDDYWTDPLKLQKQVDFLESHKEYNMVFHNAELQHHTENGVTIKPFNPEEKSRNYTADEILKTWSVATASVVCRNEEQYRYLEDNPWFPVGDTPYFIKCASLGKLYYMAEQMSVYRMLPTGLVNSEEHKSFEFNLKLLEYYKVLYEDFSDILSEKTIGHLLAINYFWAALRYRKKGDEKEYFRHLTLGMAQDPEHTIKQITKQKDNHIKSLQENLKLKNKTIQDLQEEVKQKNNHLHIIFGTISQLVRISGRTEPIKKFKAYKEMLKIYHKIKKDLILR